MKIPGMHRFGKLPLFKKLSLIMLTGALITLVCSIFFASRLIVGTNEKLLMRAISNSLVSGTSIISDCIDRACIMSENLGYDTNVLTHLETVKDSKDISKRRFAFNDLTNTVNSFYWQYKDPNVLSNISLQTDTFVINSNDYIYSKIPKSIIEEVNQQARENDGRLSVNTTYATQYGVFITRVIRRTTNFQFDHLAVLTINIDIKKLVENATKVSWVFEPVDMRLTKGLDILYDTLPDGWEAGNGTAQSENGYDIVSHNREKYLAVHGSIDDLGWQYICAMSYKTISKSQVRSMALFIIALTATFIALLYLLWRLSRPTLAGFTMLAQRMRTYDVQSFQPEVIEDEFSKREDEIGFLYRQFNEMASNTARLVQEKYAAELLAKDIQIQALEKQIHPHFLYNVLQSIQWRAMLLDATEIAEMADSLGKLLRMTLSGKDKMITLERELDLVRNYIRIQQLRFEEQLVFTLSADETLLNILIPKLMIQPLVENAVRYAVETGVDPSCDIAVHVFSGDEYMTIEVKNSGSNFEENLMEKILGNTAETHGFGISLFNIWQRLAYTYNDEAIMQTVNEDGLAVVRIRIPNKYLRTSIQEDICTD